VVSREEDQRGERGNESCGEEKVGWEEVVVVVLRRMEKGEGDRVDRNELDGGYKMLLHPGNVRKDGAAMAH